MARTETRSSKRSSRSPRSHGRREEKREEKTRESRQKSDRHEDHRSSRRKLSPKSGSEKTTSVSRETSKKRESSKKCDSSTKRRRSRSSSRSSVEGSDSSSASSSPAPSPSKKEEGRRHDAGTRKDKKSRNATSPSPSPSERRSGRELPTPAAPKKDVGSSSRDRGRREISPVKKYSKKDDDKSSKENSLFHTPVNGNTRGGFTSSTPNGPFSVPPPPYIPPRNENVQYLEKQLETKLSDIIQLKVQLQLKNQEVENIKKTSVAVRDDGSKKKLVEENTRLRSELKKLEDRIKSHVEENKELRKRIQKARGPSDGGMELIAKGIFSDASATVKDAKNMMARSGATNEDYAFLGLGCLLMAGDDSAAKIIAFMEKNGGESSKNASKNSRMVKEKDDPKEDEATPDENAKEDAAHSPNEKEEDNEVSEGNSSREDASSVLSGDDNEEDVEESGENTETVGESVIPPTFFSVDSSPEKPVGRTRSTSKGASLPWGRKSSDHCTQENKEYKIVSCGSSTFIAAGNPTGRIRKHKPHFIYNNDTRKIELDRKGNKMEKPSFCIVCDRLMKRGERIEEFFMLDNKPRLKDSGWGCYVHFQVSAGEIEDPNKSEVTEKPEDEASEDNKKNGGGSDDGANDRKNDDEDEDKNKNDDNDGVPTVTSMEEEGGQKSLDNVLKGINAEAGPSLDATKNVDEDRVDSPTVEELEAKTNKILGKTGDSVNKNAKKLGGRISKK